MDEESTLVDARILRLTEVSEGFFSDWAIIIRNHHVSVNYPSISIQSWLTCRLNSVDGSMQSPYSRSHILSVIQHLEF